MTPTTETERTRPRRRWEPPLDIEVLPHTNDLIDLRARRDRTQTAFDNAQTALGDLVDQRDELERRVLDGNVDAGRELPVLGVRITRAPEAVAAAADELAGATIDWVRHVEKAAEEVQATAREQERDLDRSNGLDKRRLFRGSREIPGARQEIQRAVAESEPLRKRQRQADRLKSDARAQLKRLLAINGNRPLAPIELARARRAFVERARAEAAEALSSK